MIAAPAILWWFRGEAFLSLTERQPAEALIVEGWIGVEGFRAAKAEFDRGGYQYIVTTGSLTGKSWTERRWSLVEIAKAELLRIGVPPDKIIAAPAPATESQRTYEAAVMAWRALQAQPFQVKAVNVFTLGAHARRSRLVYAKVFGSSTKTGVIAWDPPGYQAEPWWHSSERSEDMIKETVGYLFEALLNSGRRSNSPMDHKALAAAVGTNP